MSKPDEYLETDEDREREEPEREDWEIENDPNSDDEKERMGSSEFFCDND